MTLIDVLKYASEATTWLVANWSWVSGWLGMAALGVAFAQQKKWHQLLVIVGALAYEAAKMEGLNTDAQKAWVAHQLYLQVSTPLLKGLVTEDQCKMAVDLLWSQIDLHAAVLEKEAQLLTPAATK